MTDALFDVAPYHVPAPAPVEPISADRRRTERQQEALAAGWHPLCAAGYKIRLHADAPTDRLDRTAPGLRCGTCRFREVQGHHNRSYGKCLWPAEPRPKTGYPRITHGPGTDIRAWWPACIDHEPKAAA
jgi:hypothetical protein